jgi:hypothetical protein
MRILYDMIHARAAQHWMEPLNRGNYDQWVKHWLGTAESIHSEMLMEGLLDTASHLRKIIDLQSKYSA